jgi:hypothetical protein
LNHLMSNISRSFLTLLMQEFLELFLNGVYFLKGK